MADEIGNVQRSGRHGPDARRRDHHRPPPGVGLGMKLPKYLKKGDVMTLGIQGLGEQRQEVVGFKV